ncbi:DEAD/DEAH box helicase, partial [bacterium]|nr:DEAD/DEAH box helicase [bacterium]
MSNVDHVVDVLKKSKKSGGITSWQILDARSGILAEFPADMHPDIREALENKGIHKLYSHQLEAWQIVKAGGNPVIVTPTASGKTLCYNLPVLDMLLKNPSAKALYIYPTKALAQDQSHELLDTIGRLKTKLKVGTYDGDTPSQARKSIRGNSSIVLTNPDMLHAGILPHHSRWHRFFKELAIVVIDEIHHYRGVFGSHLCNVLRRLSRICEFHNTCPQYIMSSATLANPADLAARMIGRDVTLINRSGAPSGKKTFVFYNPPVVDQDGMIRRSYLDETLYFTRILITAGIQTIVFTRSRRNVELLLKELQRIFEISAEDRT